MAIINGTVGKNGYSFYAELIETIPSDYIETNRTNYVLKIYIKNGSKRFNSNNWTKYLKVNGVEAYNETGQNINSTVVGYNQAFEVMTVEANQPHKADGTYTVSIEAYLSKESYSDYDPGYCYLKGDIPLTTIPRTSSVTASDGYINNGDRPVYININTASSSFRHTLKYNFGGLSGTIADKYAYLDYGWVLPESLYTQIPNSTSGIGTITCETWNGNNLIGTSYVNFTARVDENQNRPTVSCSVSDTNKSLPTGYTTTDLTGNTFKFIKGVSDAQVTVSASAKNSASIVSYKTVNNSRIYNSTNFIIQNIEDSRFDVSATDSRGFVGYQNGNPTNINMVNYVPLTLNTNIYRPEPTGSEVVLTASGNYFSGSFGTQNNHLSVQYRYKETTETWDNKEFKTVTATIDSTNNRYSVSLSLGKTFDYRKSYDFQVVSIDKIKSVTNNYRLSEGIPMLAMFKDHLESFGTDLVNNINGCVNIGSNIGVKHYSREEKVSGIWIDGSIVYKKDFYYENLQSSSSSVLSLNTNLTNIKVVDTNVSVQIHNNKEDVVSNYYKSNTDHCNIHFYTSDSYIQYDCAFPNNPTYDALFTIYYRKLS